MTTRIWYDPCPRCGGEVTGFSMQPDYIRSNPEAVLSVRDPACPHEADPEAGCTCVTVINPAPSPWLDEHIVIGATFTMRPCGDVISCGRGRGPDGGLTGEMAGWQVHQQHILDPGSLAALIDDWAAAGYDLG